MAPESVEALGLPPKEALGFWRTKVPLTPKEFYALHEAARVNAFTASGVAQMDMLKQIQASLGKALAEGQSFGGWKKGLKAEIEQLGWTGHKAWRLDTIFRTNVQTAYQVGRYKQMQRTTALRPFWQYSAVNDRRTRPTHAALHGKVFAADDPFWDSWYPPNGFRCRCTVKTLSRRQVEERGLTVEQDVPQLVETAQGARPLMPDKGFETNPAQNHYQPDLADYPPEFRQAFFERVVRHVPDGQTAEAWLKGFKRALSEQDLADMETILAARSADGIEGYRRWAAEALERKQAKGETHAVGNLPGRALRALEAAGAKPRLSLVVIDDKALMHLARDAKAARGKALTAAEVASIPERFKSSDWWRDERDPALLMTWLRLEEGGVAKVVVRLDRRTGKGVANQIVSAGVVKEADLASGSYKKL